MTNKHLQIILSQIESSPLDERNDELDKQLLLETLQMISEAKEEKTDTQDRILFIKRHRKGSPLAVLFFLN